MSAKLKYDAPIIISAETKPKKSNIKVSSMKPKKAKIPKMVKRK